MEIEDLYKQRNDNFDHVTDNIHKYKSIIHSLFEYKKKHFSDMKYRKFKNSFNNYYCKLSKRNDIKVTKPFLVYAYQKMVANNEIKDDIEFLSFLRKRPSRNISGINSFALLLSPKPNGQSFTCKHNCYYCPNQSIKNGSEVDVARSYLLDEPAVKRGYRNGWDAEKQLTDRLHSLIMQGHYIDKLELILEGGTYTEYPMDYLREFHRDIFYTANTIYEEKKPEKKSLEQEMYFNTYHSKVKIIGICIETRPDAINETWIRFFRNTGVTRVQLGVQHTDNKILKKINRGHTFEQACDTVELLKNNCFKVDIHLMPDLPTATPEKDKRMFNIVMKSDKICPDALKIYPCEVTPYTIIKKWNDEKKYIPYATTKPKEFFDMMKYGMLNCPPWIRIARVIRDIPMSYICDGNKIPNIRQLIQNDMDKNNEYCRDLRSREIGRHPDYIRKPKKYKIRSYKTKYGIEYFISLESLDEKVLFGFLRLRIPSITTESKNLTYFKSLHDKGLIRELHVYNTLLPVGYKNKKVTQHKGVGKHLVEIAENISFFHSKKGMAVISGEGVRSYYQKLGYFTQDTFEIKMFRFDFTDCVLIVFSIFILLLSFLYYY